MLTIPGHFFSYIPWVKPWQVCPPLSCPSYDYELSGWPFIPRDWRIKSRHLLKCWLWKIILCSFLGMELCKIERSPSIAFSLCFRIEFAFSRRCRLWVGQDCVFLCQLIFFFLKENPITRELVCGQSLGIWLLATLHWEPWDRSSWQSRSSTHTISEIQTASGTSIV